MRGVLNRFVEGRSAVEVRRAVAVTEERKGLSHFRFHQVAVEAEEESHSRFDQIEEFPAQAERNYSDPNSETAWALRGQPEEDFPDYQHERRAGQEPHAANQ